MRGAQLRASQSCAGRSFYLKGVAPFARRGPQPPYVPIGNSITYSVNNRNERLAVVMIRRVVIVTMHRPIEIFLKTMRVAMICNYLEMVLDCLKHCRRVRRR